MVELINGRTLRDESDVEVRGLSVGQPMSVLGRTGADGRVVLSKETVRRFQGGTLLFSKPGYQCSAMPLDADAWSRFDEVLVTIVGQVMK